jgi:hypothetical protein
MFRSSSSVSDEREDMESRELDESNDGIRVEEPELPEIKSMSSGEEEEVVVAESEDSSTVLIRILKNVKYKIKGSITGNWYIFNGAGSTIQVDSQDVNEIMKKNENRPSSCCGNISGNVFEIVE